MKKIWIKKSQSFKEAQDFDTRYYHAMSLQERLEVVQFLRETYLKIKGRDKNESRKRLRRVIRVVQ
jgi:hypothetical protein